MGERLICIQEVSGSIPLGSTILVFERMKKVYRFPDLSGMFVIVRED